MLRSMALFGIIILACSLDSNWKELVQEELLLEKLESLFHWQNI